MHSLPTYLHFSREMWIAAGIGAVVALVAIAILLLASRRRYIIVRGSPATDLMTLHLGRIADAMERVAITGIPAQRERHATHSVDVTQATRETPPPLPTQPVTVPEEEPAMARHHVSLSMFGR